MSSIEDPRDERSVTQISDDGVLATVRCRDTVKLTGRASSGSPMTIRRLTVADAMIRSPKICGPHATVADVRALFVDDHVHAALVVADERVLAVVERGDLAGAADDQPAHEVGQVEGRTVEAEADLEDTRRRMVTEPTRRLAVVDRQQALLGLLCLKRTGRGFCSDADVAARAADREQGPALVERRESTT